MEDNSSEARALLHRILAVCPYCKKQVYGRDINIASIDKTKIIRWPMPYVYCHTGDTGGVHALTMYLDASFTVRAKEVSEHLTIQQE